VQVVECVPVVKKGTRTVCSYQPSTVEREEKYCEMVPVVKTIKVCVPNPCAPVGTYGGYGAGYGGSGWGKGCCGFSLGGWCGGFKSCCN
jgi:hypothetical protein